MITINQKSFSGRSVSITRNKIIVDGVDVTPENDKVINITVDGDCESVNVDVCDKIDIKGNVTKGVKTMSGDISIGGKVDGDITTQTGDVDCGDVDGTVKTMSGDVKCGTVAGNVSTLSGDIKNQK